MPHPIGRCLFCGAALDGSTRRQHVLAALVGGNIWAKAVTCSACNSYFGDHLEPELLRRYRAIRVQLAPLFKASIPKPIEQVMTSRGEPLRLLPGGIPEAMGVKVTRRTDDGKPKTVVGPLHTMDHAHRILGGDAEDHRFTYEQHPVDDDFNAEFRGYGPEYPRIAANVVLEYVDHFHQKSGKFFSVRTPGFDPVVQFARHGSPCPTIPLDRIHAYPHRIRVVRRLAEELAFPEANFAHRILFCGDPDHSRVWGLLSLYDGDMWVVLLAEDYDGPALTHLYQRAILEGEEDTHRTVPEVLLQLEEFTDHQWQVAEQHQTRGKLAIGVRPILIPSRPGQLGVHASRLTQAEWVGVKLHDRFKDLYRRVLAHSESRQPAGLLSDVLYRLREKDIVSVEDVIDAIEPRLAKLFVQSPDGWKSEWPYIRASFLRSAPQRTFDNPGIGFEDPSPDTEVARYIDRVYRDLFRECVKSVGQPGRIINRGIEVGG